MTRPAIRPAIRLLIADDQQLMRDGLASLLGIQEGIEIVGLAENGQDAIEKARTLAPNVILMDVRMPVMDGVEATRIICREMSVQVLMLTTFDDDEYVIKALQAGASGYLLKDLPAQDLAEAVQMVHRGIYQLDPAVAGKLVGALNRPTLVQPSIQNSESDLTEREIEVLRLIATGATNREIAARLVISEGTVKNHVSNILSRLGLRDRTQAAIYAREQGLI